VVGKAHRGASAGAGLSFTGSTETGSFVGETAGRMHKRLSLEMGGKNAQIVLDDADLELALDGVLWGAFGTTGQRCTATSRLILQDGIHDRVRGAARGARSRRCDSVTAAWRAPTWGRSCTRRHARRSSATWRSGGGGRDADVRRSRPTGGAGHGFFFEPTIFTGVKAGSRLEQEEIFGPVLSVIRVKTPTKRSP
jgi:alpha-ketoglutaric semialdehyde dehydrogenase